MTENNQKHNGIGQVMPQSRGRYVRRHYLTESQRMGLSKNWFTTKHSKRYLRAVMRKLNRRAA